MKFKLVYEKSGDEIELETKYNQDLLEFFVNEANIKNTNLFTDSREIFNTINPLVTHNEWSLSKTNEVLYDLIGISFDQKLNLLEYLDQDFLNKQHESWVLSQKNILDIDELRYSDNKKTSDLGWQLHELYPDDERKIRLAEAMIKLGYIFPYEEVNQAVHRIESSFTKRYEFKSDAKWQVIDNPYYDSFVSNNDVVNFSFGYTYVGRQYYDKWHYYDTDLKCTDHYNYETLEWAFQFNLDRPETIPYSKEFLDWRNEKGVRPITNQIPFGNVVDLEKNLTKYRSILYENSMNNNKLTIILGE